MCRAATDEPKKCPKISEIYSFLSIKALPAVALDAAIIVRRYCRSIVLKMVLVHGRSEWDRLFRYYDYPDLGDLGQTCILLCFKLVEFSLAGVRCRAWWWFMPQALYVWALCGVSLFWY